MSICRACGEHPGEDNHLRESLQKYFDIYFNLTSIKLTPDEDPNRQRICDDCHLKLLEYNRFRTVCLQVHYKLTEIKKEPDIELVECKPEQVKVEDVDTYEQYCIEDDPKENDDSVEDSKRNESSDDETYACELLSDSDEESDPEVVDTEELDTELVEPETTGTRSKRKTRKTKVKSEPKEKEKQIDCHLCEKKFRSDVRFQGHLRVHQGLKPALCTICGKDFAKYANLKMHVARHHTGDYRKFPCDHPGCELVYSTKQSMTNHRRTHDPNYVKPELKRCMCDLCGKTFSTAGALKKHSYIHSGDMPFQCNVCNKKLPTAHKLKEHKMRHEGIKNYVCPHCGMKKTTRHELKVHINYHTREKQFNCHVCGQIFSNIGNMSRHIKIVHCGIKAFNCTYCDRSFGKAETLKHHVMTHTGEKPHVCTTCGKRFIQMVALQTHMKTHRKHETKPPVVQQFSPQPQNVTLQPQAQQLHQQQQLDLSLQNQQQNAALLHQVGSPPVAVGSHPHLQQHSPAADSPNCMGGYTN